MSRSGGSSSKSKNRLHKNSNSDSDESEGSAASTKNIFKNDGSFLEMFKKMQERKDNVVEPPKIVPPVAVASTSVAIKLEEPKPQKVLPLVGKRRGGRALPTGLVKKSKKGPHGEDEEAAAPKDAWSQYMAEVRRYKETSCEEEGKTRPLVK